MEPSQFRTTEGQPPETSDYRLKAGAEHTHNGRRLNPGDVVGLTPRQAVAFRDKFDAVEIVAAQPEPPAPTEQPTSKFEPSAPSVEPSDQPIESVGEFVVPRPKRR